MEPPETECGTCSKVFRIPIVIIKRFKDSNMGVMKEQFCSKKCNDLHDRAWKNLKDTCFYCNKIVENYNGDNGFHLKFKEESRHPICDKCSENPKWNE
tara:strand:+ start:2946 stop:3239 length:294 start_codon:yes stop_codon:yes gene_type:complete